MKITHRSFVVWDEDVLNVEHMLTIITVMGAIVAGARILIPDPNIVFCPEKTLTAVMAHIHYFPDSWKGEAHTSRVMAELGELFPYTAVYLLHEIISPILTPFILLFGLRSRSGAIVDFFRNFTVDVVGVGDVCSFAQVKFSLAFLVFNSNVAQKASEYQLGYETNCLILINSDGRQTSWKSRMATKRNDQSK